MKKLSTLKPGKSEEFVLLLTAAEERTTRNNASYCVMTLSDGETKITANLWDSTFDMIELLINKVVKAMITASTYNGSVSYKIDYIFQTDEQPIADFVKKVPVSTEDMYEEILRMIPECNLKTLVEAIYTENKDKLLYWSAAKSVHHNLYGGLLYHTYRMMKMALSVCSIYPGSLNASLLLCGCALHDIGKLQELETTPLGEATYTVSGNLLGHAVIGIEMISRAAKAFEDISEEEIMLLKHLIASHHGKLEYGAVTIPAIPEAVVLNRLDDMDARIYIFEDRYSTMDEGTLSDSSVFGLDNAVIYKPSV